MEIVSPMPLGVPNSEWKKIFLGGTIANGKADKWHSIAVQALGDLPVYLMNPRRTDWDTNAGSEEKKKQIQWEIDAQRLADIILYNFCQEFISPITLHELGLFCRHEKVIVCCPPNYLYFDNVQFTCNLFNIPLFYTLTEALDKIRTIVNNF